MQSGLVNYGQTPVYSGATPTKASDADYSYAFNVWTPSIATVIGNATYTATFTATEFNLIEIDSYSSKAIVADEIAIPSASIVGKVSGNFVTDEGITVSATFGGNSVDVSSGTYQPLESGSLVITYSADGLENVTATITVDNKVRLVYDGDIISKTSYVNSYATSYKIGDVSDAQVQFGKGFCIQVKCPSESSSYLTFDVNVGDVSNYVSLQMTFWLVHSNGAMCHLKAGGNNGTALYSGNGNRSYNNPVTVTNIPTSYVSNGKLRLTLQQDYYNTCEIYFEDIKGVCAPIFTDVISTSLINKQINPTANYKIRGIAIASDINAISATFNGDSVVLPYTPTTTGTLTLNYVYGGNSKSFNVSIVDKVRLAYDGDFVSKTSYVAYYGNSYKIGNVSDAMAGSFASPFCAQFKCPSAESSYLTFDVDVGDVSDYSSLELLFCVYVSDWYSWSVKAGGTNGTVLSSGTGSRAYGNQILLTNVSTSYVSNGKSRLTLQQDYYGTCEFYIDYIKGVA